MRELFLFFIKKLLTNRSTCCIINFVRNEYVSVAQLDRASDYGSEGRVFESCHSHLNRKPKGLRFLFYHGESQSEKKKHRSCLLGSVLSFFVIDLRSKLMRKQGTCLRMSTFFAQCFLFHKKRRHFCRPFYRG